MPVTPTLENKLQIQRETFFRRNKMECVTKEDTNANLWLLHEHAHMCFPLGLLITLTNLILFISFNLFSFTINFIPTISIPNKSLKYLLKHTNACVMICK